MMASDGKCYNTQAADMQGMFRIIQSIPSPMTEPFKQWMAQVAAQRIDQMLDPELSIDQDVAEIHCLFSMSVIRFLNPAPHNERNGS